jgi:hypothetical protein
MGQKHFINKYKVNHMSRRKTFKKYLNKGYVQIVEKNKNGILYEVLPGYEITISRKGVINLKKF